MKRTDEDDFKNCLVIQRATLLPFYTKSQSEGKAGKTFSLQMLSKSESGSKRLEQRIRIKGMRGCLSANERSGAKRSRRVPSFRGRKKHRQLCFLAADYR